MAPGDASRTLCVAAGFPLGIKIYYILCSSTESTLIIVAWVRRRKRFLMHKSTAAKPLKNQRAIQRSAIAAPFVHRFSTMLYTAAKVYAGRGACEGIRAYENRQ
jgi:hypothetical protein